MSLMDLYPTLLDIAGVSPDSLGITLDGQSRKDELLGNTPAAESDEILYFYCMENLVAARVGNYKVHFRQSLFQNENTRFAACNEGFPESNALTKDCPELELDPWLVFNVETDPGELWPLSVDRLGDDVISKLNSKMTIPDDELSDPLLTIANIRGYVSPCCNPPYCFCTQ